MHRTKWARAEREREEDDYSMERGENIMDDRGKEGWGEYISGSSGDGSGAIGASTYGDDEY